MPHMNRLNLLLCVLLLVIASALPTSLAAQPATKLYVGHFARLTAQIPSDWTVDPTGTFDYVGADGFVSSRPLAGQSLDESCTDFATSPLFEANAEVDDTTWSGQSACRINGVIKHTPVQVLVVPHPHPFDMFGSELDYAAVIADPGDFDAIVSTLDFSPDRVTPEAYVSSVIDLIEARAYWAGDVDWQMARREALASLEDEPSIEGARATIFAILGMLRSAGDNHSSIVFAGQEDPLAVSNGIGMIVGGRQVLEVYEDGPADRAGLRAGDIIETVNGEQFYAIPFPADPEYLWGHSVELTLRRPGAPEPIRVAVEEGVHDLYAAPTGRRLAGDIGYLKVPLFRIFERGAEYATTANRIIASADQAPTCGWVIDLRLNMGGAYFPMATGVGPILGNGPFVGWRSADGRQTWVAYEDGRIIDDGQQVSDYFGGQMYKLQNPNPPVAVLIGPSTASAGEIATLAFVGRPDTRLFGQQTAGFTTAIEISFLFDGTRLGLATSAMIDRTGATHLQGIEPDELIPIDWTAYGTKDDAVLNAAVDWLNQQPACANAASPTP